MVKIISDSTCDLSPELVNRYDIDILPLHILLGEKEYKDGKNITPDEIFAWSDAHKTTPKTSAPSLEAAVMAQAGKSAAEITAALEEVRPKVRASFVVDTLMYLYRGGRCNAVAAMAGSVLKLHPKIVVENGAMDAAKKYRGKLHSVVMSYVRDMEADLKNARPERVFITHSGCDRKIVEDVQAYLQSLGIFQEILETRAGGVVSSHCGPGTLGVLFIAK